MSPPPLSLLPSALSDLYAQSSTSGIITVADRYGLLAALLKEPLSDEEKAVIDRIIRSVRRGRMRVVNEISVIL